MSKNRTNKEILIKKSMQVFIKNGYYHTTFSNLAKACNIEKPHFYYYFKSKNDLMNEVLIHASKQIEKLVFNIASDNKIEPSVRLSTMLDNALKIHTKTNYGCLMGNTILETIGREAYFMPVLREYFHKWENALVCIYSTSFKEDIALNMAHEDISKLQGSIMLMRLYKNKEIFRKVIDGIKNRI